MNNSHLTPTRRTKIVATIGPASASPEVIAAMIKNGLNVARMNFSHGTHEGHSEVLQTVRREARRLGRHIAVFQDLCGPKVRIGKVEDDKIPLIDGNEIRLCYATASSPLGNSDTIYVEAFDPVKVVKPGEKALLSDGQIELVAERVTKDAVICRVSSGGELRSRSGISVPESQLDLPCITEKDRKDVVWAVENKVDYIALSFVASARDIVDLRRLIKELGGSIPIIAKIERATSIDNMVEIIEASDAVMVARGDLGLELPLEKVPSAQRLIIRTSNFRGTPVITATQMLRSMVHDARPTRAEVSDVFTAVRDGTDCVMLSEETAIGKNPGHVISVLDRILREAERECQLEGQAPSFLGADRSTVADAVCYASAGAAEKLNAGAIVACTYSGYSARLMAKYRPRQPLYGFTTEESTLNRMSIYWGVQPVHVRSTDGTGAEEEITNALEVLRDEHNLKPGTRVVVTAGLRSQQSGSTSLMQVREIPRP
ncbi:MAG: pyruvate kinase [bacterium]|nr:pyruvate kinase [bacterium]